MTALLFVLIILVSLIYVLFPLFNEPYWPFLKRGTLSELHSAHKEGVIAITDLDEEYAMGKLTREDYVHIRDGLKHDIAPVMKKEIEISREETSFPDGRGRNGLTAGLLREVIRICGIKN
jgi:hypothetical protein